MLYSAPMSHQKFMLIKFNNTEELLCYFVFMFLNRFVHNAMIHAQFG